MKKSPAKTFCQRSFIVPQQKENNGNGKLVVNHSELFQTPGVYDNQLSLQLNYYYDKPLNFY